MLLCPALTFGTIAAYTILLDAADICAICIEVIAGAVVPYVTTAAGMEEFVDTVGGVVVQVIAVEMDATFALSFVDGEVILHVTTAEGSATVEIFTAFIAGTVIDRVIAPAGGATLAICPD